MTARPGINSLMLLLALCALPFLATATAATTATEAGASGQQARIVDHGWHTGIIVPAQPAEALMPFLQQRFYRASYYEFGWGDQGFYQAEEITLPLVLQALFTRSQAVMHVVAIRQPPATFFTRSEQRELTLHSDALHALLLAIRDSFALDENNKTIALRQGIYGDSHFYRARGHYHLFNTCNSWTAMVIEQAGFASRPWFDLTAAAVMRWVRRLAGVSVSQAEQPRRVFTGDARQAGTIAGAQICQHRQHLG